MKTVTIYLTARPCFPALGYRDESGALRIGQPGGDCSRPLTKRLLRMLRRYVVLLCSKLSTGPG